MTKLFIEDLDCQGKKILLRVDFNVPLDGDRNILDTTRIEASLPSIRYLLEQGGAVILLSHLGRPPHAPTPELSLAPVAKALSAFLNRPVKFAPNCVGEEVTALAKQLKKGELLLLENLRFHRAEEFPEEDPTFAEQLAELGDLYVNDAFASSHRKHSSIYTLPHHFPNAAAAGYLLQKEIHYLGELLAHPKRPFYALLGGAKISTKIGVIKALLQKVDKLLIGGAMAYTFLKAKGIEVGHSLVEKEQIPLASELLKKHGEKIVLPLDAHVALTCSEDAPAKYVLLNEGIPPEYEGLDMGPETLKLFQKHLSAAQTILWNGPIGVYEFDRFAKGTHALLLWMGNSKATTLLGGGDLLAAVNQAGLADKISHLSTGGGATLEYIEKGTLPGIEALSTKVPSNQS